MSETKNEPYQLSKCTIRIVITLFPKNDGDSDLLSGVLRNRSCLIAASTHDDLPIAKCVNFSDLQPLPKPVKEILKQLKEELPKRKFNAEVKEFKAQKTNKPESSNPPNETETKSETTKSNQTTLFD